MWRSCDGAKIGPLEILVVEVEEGEGEEEILVAAVEEIEEEEEGVSYRRNQVAKKSYLSLKLCSFTCHDVHLVHLDIPLGRIV